MRPTNKSEILDFIKRNKASIISYGVRRIGLFGSFVRNAQKEDSDIDILVEFDQEKLSYKNFISLAYFLEDSFDRKVDLLTADSLSPYLGPKILSEVEYVSL